MHNYIDLFHKYFSDMTKTGKSSAYWNDICHRYAQGTFQFSTGKRPGSKKWKEALERIDACPLQRGNKVDLFGRQIVCTCGFHKVGILIIYQKLDKPVSCNRLFYGPSILRVHSSAE